MIFADSLPRFKDFFGDCLDRACDLTNATLLIASFLMPLLRRSVSAAAWTILEDARDATWLLRWLGLSNAPAALLAAAQQRLLLASAQRGRRLHVLVLDSTCHSQQGQCTENTFSTGNREKRPTKSNRKQKKVHRKSSHCFVFALLLTPDGLRIPYFLPFYTKGYCAERHRRHLTQADLAAQLIGQVPLKDRVPVVVVGDTAFEAKQIRAACRKRGWDWIFPLNPERCLAGDAPRPKVHSLIEPLTPGDFRHVCFRLDHGELARLARVSPGRSQSKKHQRTYWVHQRTAAVHNVGTVTLLFSTQKDPNVGGMRVQKVLMSNVLDKSSEELLRWYSLRWQVELFFKEMKSELGMCQYRLTTGQFSRVVGWVSLSVAAFCYLEWYRHTREAESKGKESEAWRRMRSGGLKTQIRYQVQRAELESVLRLAAQEGGRERLSALLQKSSRIPSASAA